MNEKFTKLIAERIKAALKEREVSQIELAQMIQKSRAYVSNITKGRYLPKISELMKIAEYLKKPIGYFLGEDKPGLLSYVDKAKKWDKLVSLIETDISRDFQDDVAAIPLLDNTKLRNKTFEQLYELRKSSNNFIYVSRSYMKDTLHYHKSLEELVAVRIFIRDYPEFGIYLGDVIIMEPIKNNDIEDNSGKLFAILYKGDLSVKRIYREGKEYYFEPMHSPPQLEKIPPNNPNLVVPARVLFNFSIKTF
ncbi:helix-turn-helix domain-containing protein [Patescibacteria group bacterium]